MKIVIPSEFAVALARALLVFYFVAAPRFGWTWVDAAFAAVLVELVLAGTRR